MRMIPVTNLSYCTIFPFRAVLTDECTDTQIQYSLFVGREWNLTGGNPAGYLVLVRIEVVGLELWLPFFDTGKE